MAGLIPQRFIDDLLSRVDIVDVVDSRVKLRKTGKNYSAEQVATCLRYSRVLFMTDQDLDGSHIKGLCINLFESVVDT